MISKGCLSVLSGFLLAVTFISQTHSCSDNKFIAHSQIVR